MRILVESQSKNSQCLAVAGNYTVLLAFDAKKSATKGLLGFAIHRADLTEDESYWLKSFKTFPGSGAAPGQLVSSHEQPIQGFLWGDYTAKPNHNYIYKIVPLYGKPK